LEYFLTGSKTAGVKNPSESNFLFSVEWTDKPFKSKVFVLTWKTMCTQSNFKKTTRTSEKKKFFCVLVVVFFQHKPKKCWFELILTWPENFECLVWSSNHFVKHIFFLWLIFVYLQTIMSQTFIRKEKKVCKTNPRLPETHFFSFPCFFVRKSIIIELKK